MLTPHRKGISARRPPILAVVLAATAIVVTGCGAPTAGDTTSGSETPSGWFEHVHGVAQDGPAVLLATHEGLFRQVGNEPPVRVSDQPFDVMGFTLARNRFLASGHPAPGTDFPAQLGLGQSADGGRTWAPISLLGMVDFHRLRAVGDGVWGITANDGRLLASADAGRTWTTVSRPGLFDFAVDPADPTQMVGTTQSGPVSSTDGGRTFAPIPGAPVVVLLAWASAGLYGITPTGALLYSSNGRAGWTQTGTVTGAPQALWADGTRVAIATTRAVSVSNDGGRTFTDRVVIPPST